MRLLSTLDTLNAIQSTHTQEMSATVKGKKRAEEVGVARSAEVERDDMRDAVMKLVEKGGFLCSCYILMRGLMMMMMWF